MTDIQINDLWDRVQTNEESHREKQKILEESEALLSAPESSLSPFNQLKLKLIMHKAGKFTDLTALAVELEALAKKSSDNVDIWICLAETYLHDGKADSALTPLEFAMSLGDNVTILQLASICYRRKSNPDVNKSLEIATKALKMDMKNGKSWASVACVYLSMGGRENIVKAQNAFKFAIRNGENTNADVLLNLGTVCELLLDFNEAMAQYTEAMRITEGWALASANLGRLKNTITNVIKRCQAADEMKKKKKDDFLRKLKSPHEYVVLEVPSEKTDPSQILVCLGVDGKAIAVGVTQTMRAYIRCEKTVVNLEKAKTGSLEVDGQTIKFLKVENQRDVTINGGALPTTVPAVSISSSIA